MIQVTRMVMRNGISSAMYPKLGDISVGALAAGGWSLCPMRFAQKAMAAKIAMKISRLQPARSPSLPMNILLRVDGCTGSVGFSVALFGDWPTVSLFKGFLVWLKVYTQPSIRRFNAKRDCFGVPRVSHKNDGLQSVIYGTVT